MDDGKDILMLNELWNCTDSDTIATNVEKLLKQDGIESYNDKMNRLMEITHSTKHAVYAWFNRGRTNVKIPFLKLCAIAEAYGIEVSKLLNGGNFTMERKYAVTRVVGNNEKVLKVFGNDKEAAIAYGAEVAKTNTEGNITCVLALFNDENKMSNYEVRVFEVWES